MITQLATKYSKPIAVNLFLISYIAFLSPSYSKAADSYAITVNNYCNSNMAKHNIGKYVNHLPNRTLIKSTPAFIANQILDKSKLVHLNKKDIGGPSQPEMSTFKSIGVNNLVNTFTGDFNYNIPLLDVEGYPVNLFYNAGISPEQEASWVGLGWNLNPGNINRNMRGIPDDFDGTDTLIQKQNMRPNKTWGVNVEADIEALGIKAGNFNFTPSVGVGVSFNNYLGPALDFNLGGSTGIKTASSASSEKNPQFGVNLGVDLNSRTGLTLSLNPSLTARSQMQNGSTSFGIGLNTSYNSRSGLKALTINEQVSFNANQEYIDKNLNFRDDNNGRINENLFSTTISFVKPSYVPAIRMPLTNSAYSGHLQFGGGIFGGAVDIETEVYLQQSKVAPKDIIQYKPMVGYLYYQNATANSNMVMDMTRFNDQEVTPNTPVISVPQYTYDVFSIQGEGTGGSIRAYRNELGYVRDNYTKSKDESFSLGGDIDPPGHFGANFNTITTPSTIGDWETGNTLRNTIGFKNANGTAENVYFRNPGEMSVVNTQQLNAIGGTDLVRFKIGGSAANAVVYPTLERFNSLLQKNGTNNVSIYPSLVQRSKRSQVTSFLTADQARIAGLDTLIKSYNEYILLDNNNNLLYDSMPRVGSYRKGHHLSEIDVTESNGKRYIYGIPVYNVTQEDFTFSVTGANNPDADKVNVDTTDKWMDPAQSGLLNNNSSVEGYAQETIIPPYAHSFLLSGLLSPDYVDVTGNGITPDDIGTAIKFNYTRIKNTSGWYDHQWRTPLTAGDSAHFNPGNHSETKDDKGIVSYGIRESWYLHSIESKNLIAIFHISNRNDGKCPIDSTGGINGNDSSLKKLDRIDLYNKSDLKANGLVKAKPIKSVLFSYSYTLCEGSPDNFTAQGKLTLDSIYFIFNGQNRNVKNKYAFSYVDSLGNGNPNYRAVSSDRWGTYKPSNLNPAQLVNAYYPYSLQDSLIKSTIDQNAGAWCLKRILLPSGGQIEVNYESDDYAYVQNKRAEDMMQIVGFGNSFSANYNQQLYSYSGDENYYVFVKVPQPCYSPIDVYQKYLQGNTQLLAKLGINMTTKGNEDLNSYFTYSDYGITPDNKIIWLKMNAVDGHSPLVLSAMEFLRQRLPGQAFDGYDVSDESGWTQFAEMLISMLETLQEFGKDPINIFKSANPNPKAQLANLNRCFIRLNDPDGFKYGGGHRVKSIILKDNWDKMAGSYLSEYGQKFDYTTTEVFNGQTRTISSGVASYEPAIGGDENPFTYMVQIEDKVPLGPASYGAVEMPVTDAFFPSASVGYSKVTVTSIQSIKYDTTQFKSRSGIGKQVTEYYTAKDYPVYYSNTSIDPSTDIESHDGSQLAFFYKWQYDYKNLSQGFLVVNNDMHGKMKSQSSYAANDDKTLINYTENFYRNTGGKGLNETFDFVSGADSGKINAGNMGIDIELMTDTRQFTVKSTSREVQGQLDLFPVVLPFLIPTIWKVNGESENTYRAVTTAKIINYHAVLDSVIVIDKGSQVSTKNLVYDAETGGIIVSRTNNEFNQPVYNTSYPAYWAYSGMGPAYKNVGAIFNNLTFSDGRITNPDFDKSVFESGDELLILSNTGTSADCHPAITGVSKLWAYDTAKNSNSGLTNPNPYLIFIDSTGNIYSNSSVTCQIIRSGHRNMLDEQVETFTSMASPIVTNNGITSLVLNNNTNVINSTATEYKEKWQTDKDVFERDTLIDLSPSPPTENLIINGDFESGNIYPSQSDYTNRGTCNGTTSDTQFSVCNESCNNGEDPPPYDHHNPQNQFGYEMLVDGATDSQKRVWEQIVNVNPNSDYEFSFWATNLDERPKLQIKINDIPIDTFQLTSDWNTWKQYTLIWNSGSSTSAKITFRDNDITHNGNDFVLDDIFFKAIPNSCNKNFIEVPSCYGYLQKHINPYKKGIIGNFKAERSWIFYGSRNETNPTGMTNIPANGYLANFSSFWNFNSLSNLTFNATTDTSWVWNNMITRANAKGLELETKNALNIYTSAQYGYNKTLPVGITNNSQYNEMFVEGFEDNDYNENLNTSGTLNCINNKFVNLGSLGTVFPADSLGFNAHSGKRVLSVTNNSTLNVPVSPNLPNNFNVRPTYDTSKTLKDIGLLTGLDLNNQGIIDYADFTNHSYGTYTADYSTPSKVVVYPSPDNLTGTNFWSTYIEIKNSGIYNFTMSYAFNGSEGLTGGTFSVYIADQNGNYGYNATDYSGHPMFTYGLNDERNKTLNMVTEKNKDYNVYLCKGIYQIIGFYSITYSSYSYISNNLNLTWQCTNGSSQNYSSLSTQNGCISTVPIPANDSMMNPSFTLTPGKKMWFSSWVRENCNGNLSAGIPCTDTTYTHGSVQISFNNGQNTAILKPSGPIIDGWQKIEGAFTVPQGATSATLSLLNSNTQSIPIYFDDIRIHPFNADMKSYVYDPINLRLVAELDANNYATYYEYDEEGTLIRTKVETQQGIKTINETRSAKQKNITNIQ